MKKSIKNNIKYIRNINRKKIILKIIYILMIIGIAYNIIYFINTKITKNDYVEFFGVSLFSIKSDAMEKELNKNDLAVVKKVKEDSLKTDDIIAYKVNDKIRIDKIHKIIKKGEKNEYVTISNKSLYPNNEHIEEGQVIGKVVNKVSKFGVILNILQAKLTIFFVLIVLLLLFSNVCYKEKKYRQRKIKKSRKS